MKTKELEETKRKVRQQTQDAIAKAQQRFKKGVPQAIPTKAEKAGAVRPPLFDLTQRRPRTRAERMLAFIEVYCRVPEGKLVGQPMRLEPFQVKFIYDTYDNPAPGGTRRAYLSTARKNGKTAFMASLALGHIVGPEAVQNSQVVSGALSRDQAALLFKLMCKMVEFEPQLEKRVHMVPSRKTLYGLSKNVEYHALSSDGKTSQGLSPVLALLDEVGQIDGPTDRFFDAIVTAQGAHDNPLLMAISTQSATDGDLFSIWIDDAIESKDSRIVCHLHAAESECDLLDEAQWKKANPAMGVFRSYEDVKEQAERAFRMPSSESTFRNLVLNQRVSLLSPFVSQTVWEANAKPAKPLTKDTKVWGGLDLASVSDLTALALVTEDYHVHSTFWLPSHGLEQKSRDDRVPYDVWAREGSLQLVPGKAIDYQYVAEHMRKVFDACDVQAIAFDRYNFKFLRPCLVNAKFSEEEIAKFIEFGQGFVSMSPAIRALEVSLLKEDLHHSGHAVLRFCARNATIVKDQAGNRKFARHNPKKRIDGMVALAMAVGVMPVEPPNQEEEEKEYQMFVL